MKHGQDLLQGQSPCYRTKRGAAYCGDSLNLLSKLPDDSVNLVITSPPFALQRKKAYGNKEQHEYVGWLKQFGRLVYEKLATDGSFVLDLGGAYKKGVPERSLYNFRVLIEFCDELGFHLAEDFYWFNPSKLPGPIEWVNKRKLRAKDSVNTVWWLSKSQNPKADISKVLAPYSERMLKLLKDPDAFYRAKKRPSGHDISMRFGTDNGGSIPSNLLEIPNSESNGQYMSGCGLVGATLHPARFPAKLPLFFMRMLTEPNDLVVDIFSGSNTTGWAAEALHRRWLSFELNREYVAASAFRFLSPSADTTRFAGVFSRIAGGESVNLTDCRVEINGSGKKARSSARSPRGLVLPLDGD